MSESLSVCFTIGGDWLTQHCRSLWAYEGKQDLALKTLLTGLPGITNDQALSVLDGRCKLVGDSNTGLDLVADESGEKLPTLLDTLKKTMEERDEARDGEADLMQLYLGDTVGVASPGGLRHVPKRKTEMRSTTVGDRRCLKRGYDWEDMPKATREQGAKPVKYYRTDPVLSDANEYYRAVKNGFKPVCEEPEDEPEAPAPPLEVHDEICSHFGWLSPEGKFFVCSYGEHILTAKRLGSTEPELEKKGWVKIAKSLDGVTHIFGFLGEERAKPTEVQLKLVRDFCMINHVELPYWAEDD